MTTPESCTELLTGIKQHLEKHEFECIILPEPWVLEPGKTIKTLHINKNKQSLGSITILENEIICIGYVSVAESNQIASFHTRHEYSNPDFNPDQIIEFYNLINKAETAKLKPTPINTECYYSPHIPLLTTSNKIEKPK